ncbi:MAG: GAF domain-containing protein [Deltaproteobacteria bacterium]|nr:GAF domain-containing protein [Deltaproteobacteria bacterium]
MSSEDRINMDIFRIVTKAVAKSEDLETMTNHLSQLLVVTLGIKGCAIFILNPDTKELERLASFGLGISYLTKGPIQADKSLGDALKGEPVIVRDVSHSAKVQYPEKAKEEGIAAIVSIPITFLRRPIGVLRLYEREVWDISKGDVDLLLILAEIVGLAMGYTRLSNTLQSIDEEVNELHRFWLQD